MIGSFPNDMIGLEERNGLIDWIRSQGRNGIDLIASDRNSCILSREPPPGPMIQPIPYRDVLFMMDVIHSPLL
ncbi:hypothetical protein FRX31_008591 [Thalictrum thalictroides]|uniref:Uncharacterized protein n=1 Tax=Thalictrum thalictroides TaxID=46969 RepID=A0A7J6WXN8_THATH|nr:hypothetical protein FRX31_008591 [Thalictrum thalictroides]